jgi:hypothetical protein
MGHPNSKTHKAKHAGYREKPTQQAVNSNLGLWAAFANETPVDNSISDELEKLFGETSEQLVKIGTQLKLF